MSSILITGGTGTIGSSLVKYYLNKGTYERVIVFSRDEFKQSEMRKKYSNPCLRFFLGDIRDKDRLMRACEGVDVIVHAAALKRIESGERDPIEVVKTNVDGTINVVDAALDNDVLRLILISTDKAVLPTCLYGHTKAVAESLTLHASAYAGHRRTSFGVVRMGNIAGSRGSVIPFFNELKKQRKSLPVTDVNMTRYLVSTEMACDTIDRAINSDYEQVFTPDPPAFRLIDLLEAYGCNWHTVGKRQGEKLHEQMTEELSSDKAERFLTVDELREIIE